MGSTRLPGKVLKVVCGKPLLETQIERVRKAKRIDRIVVATSTLPHDQPIAELCERLGVPVYRGSEQDVLSRFFETAQQHGASVIVRLTADCPLIDPAVIDATVELFVTSSADYAANTVPPKTSRFPDGSDVEVFSYSALEKAHRDARDTADREHVTFYFWKHGHPFKTVQLQRPENWSSYRLTVDYPEDLTVVEKLLTTFHDRGEFAHLPDIIAELDRNPELRKQNAMHFFGEGWKKPTQGAAAKAAEAHR